MTRTAREARGRRLLVERGIVVDDKRPHLELTGIPEQRVGGKPTRVELVVEVIA